MRVKRLLDLLKTAHPEALVVVEYPQHRCKGEHGRLRGVAHVDDVSELSDVPRRVSGAGFIGSDTPESDIYTEHEVRLRIERDEYP